MRVYLLKQPSNASFSLRCAWSHLHELVFIPNVCLTKFNFFIFVLLLRSSSCTIRTKKRNLNSCFYSVRVEPCFYMSKILIFVQATTQLYTRVIFCWKKMYPSCELFCIYPSCVSHVWTVLCERSTGRV